VQRPSGGPSTAISSPVWTRPSIFSMKFGDLEEVAAEGHR